MSEQKLWSDEEIDAEILIATDYGSVIQAYMVRRMRDAYETDLARLRGENSDLRAANDRLCAEAVVAQRRIRELEDATEWEPALDGTEFVDEDEQTLTIDDGWISVTNVYGLTISWLVGDDVRIFRRRPQVQP